MGIILPASTLRPRYVRISPWDTALIRDDEAALGAAFKRFHETGDMAALEPFIKAGEKPTQFVLRHLRGRANAELDATMHPTRLPDGAPTDKTFIEMARLCLADVIDWDGANEDGSPRKLTWKAHAEYPFKILTDESFDDLCDVGGGVLAWWLGAQAWEARHLSPL